MTKCDINSNYSQALQWFVFNGFGQCPKFVEVAAKAALQDLLGITRRTDIDPEYMKALTWFQGEGSRRCSPWVEKAAVKALKEKLGIPTIKDKGCGEKENVPS